MMHKTFLIHPGDVVRFGAGTPAQAELEHILRSRYMPTPYTLRGAIWSLLIEQNNLSYEEFRSILPAKKDMASGLYRNLLDLKILLWGIRKDGDYLVHVPLDVVKNKEKEDEYLVMDNLKTGAKDKKYLLKSLRGQSVSIDFIPSGIKVENVHGFMKLEVFTHYLETGKLSDNFKQEETLFTEEDLFEKERREQTAIAGERGVAEEGRLFTTEFVGLKNGVEYFVEFEIPEDVKIGNSGVILLGGDMRIAKYSEAEDGLFNKLESVKEKIKEKVKQSGIFKIILLTPGIFEKGYLIDYDEDIMELLSLGVGSYTTISGWSLSTKGSRPAFRAVPEGSYYVFRLKDKNKVDEIFDKFYLKPNSMNEEFNKLGFGLCVIGIVNRENKNAGGV